jgi:hypothetical protein
VRIIAKFAGACAWCATPILVGQRCRWYVESRELRCVRACPPAALAAEQDRVRQALLGIVRRYCQENGITWRPIDDDPTARGSLAWVLWPTLTRIERDSRPRAHA